MQQLPLSLMKENQCCVVVSNFSILLILPLRHTYYPNDTVGNAPSYTGFVDVLFSFTISIRFYICSLSNQLISTYSVTFVLVSNAAVITYVCLLVLCLTYVNGALKLIYTFRNAFTSFIPPSAFGMNQIYKEYVLMHI